MVYQFRNNAENNSVEIQTILRKKHTHTNKQTNTQAKNLQQTFISRENEKKKNRRTWNYSQHDDDTKKEREKKKKKKKNIMGKLINYKNENIRS